MKQITQVDRIKRFKLTYTLNDNGVERHFHCGHEYVEIGGIKWATMNVGAEKVTDCGKYFAWGETNGFNDASEKRFTWEDYKFGYDTSKYNFIDDKTVLEPIDDAARVNWGGQWRMPTDADFQALGSAVNTEWTTDYQGSGVAGVICTDKTDSSKVLFFPAYGYCYKGIVRYVGGVGNYWSSSLHSYDFRNAYVFDFYYGSLYWQTIYCRYIGISVRGVVG